MNESTNNALIDLLIKNEEAIGSLYKACALQFPGFAEFWQKIALEEKAHADVLRELAKHLQNQKVLLNHRKFNTTAVQTTIDYILKQREKVESGSMTLLQVLAAAQDIEQSIVDRDFFEVFETDSASMRLEFAALRKHTVEHTACITAALNKLRNP
ncbi:MAG: hypothetical protein A2283_00345 [Lentisphaerae bacterium RIFOXYA12_FULL_48_11]|nr:MAG: hypothetical protein A2283_00345 [Lentisphaerae bacterium RIFOXYA12_FULL_48_11]